MIWFTSDLHLGHQNSIKYSNRPFSSIDEMDDCLLTNINDIVNSTDDLYILGDFAYRVDFEQIKIYRERIRCKNVHLILGNHDKKSIFRYNIFNSIDYYCELKTDYGSFILFHYPIEHWNKAHYGSVHLHGHIHADSEYNIKNLDTIIQYPTGLEIQKRVYDVGVDANEYKPVSLIHIADWFGLTKIK